MLKADHLTKRFGGLAAVNDVSVEFAAGQINAIIGPNGAGKTTFFNLVAGALPVTAGSIEFNGMDVTHLAPDRIARLGIARTFQTTQLFEQSTVLDNLIVGHRLRTRSRLWDVIINSRRLREEEQRCRAKAMEVLDFVELSHIGHRYIADTTQEERKRVAFALALATEPELVLLDEPAGGINLEETEKLGGLIRKMIEHDITVCLIEHKMDMVMNLADSIIVLDHGKKIAEGTPEQIKNDPLVIEAYLGSEEDVEA